MHEGASVSNISSDRLERAAVHHEDHRESQIEVINTRTVELDDAKKFFRDRSSTLRISVT